MEKCKEYLLHKKQDANLKKWLYVDVEVKELLSLFEEDVETCCKAMMDCMLEGDRFLKKTRNGISRNLTIRYYVDNLHVSRKSYKQ